MSNETPATARGLFVRGTSARILTNLLDRSLAALTADQSSSLGSLPMRERLAATTALAILRPVLPQFRNLLLSKLSAGDPDELERGLGALAIGIEQLLAAAPGDPLPRYRPGWQPDGSLVLVPLEDAAEGLQRTDGTIELGAGDEPCVDCPDELEPARGQTPIIDTAGGGRHRVDVDEHYAGEHDPDPDA